MTLLRKPMLMRLDHFWLHALQTTTILVERLQAWKHVCGHLENYISVTHKVQRSQAKEIEKVLKVWFIFSPYFMLWVYILISVFV